MPNDHRRVTQAFILQASRECSDGAVGGAQKARLRREIFDRIAGEGHLAGGDKMSAGVPRATHGIHDEISVAGEVSDNGV